MTLFIDLSSHHAIIFWDLTCTLNNLDLCRYIKNPFSRYLSLSMIKRQQQAMVKISKYYEKLIFSIVILFFKRKNKTISKFIRIENVNRSIESLLLSKQ